MSSPVPIAIVGMACRTAGADSPDELWSLLRDGVRAIRTAPPERLVGLDPGTVTIDRPRAGLLDSIDLFDAAFFGMSRRMASWADPHQRLLLELAWHALESAGIPPDALSGKPIAVITTTGTSDFQSRMIAAGRVDPAALSGTMQTFIPNRISYQFDWTGPSYAVDSSCSSGLTALSLAVHGLQHGEYPMALVGAANLLCHGFGFSSAYRAGALSPTGRSVPFSGHRDGYIRGEGGVCLVLKPLMDAERDGDPIQAVIRSVAVAHDGRAGGLTGTDPATQAALTARNTGAIGLTPHAIGYLEAHGTGTGGDLVEMAGVLRALAATGADNGTAAGPDGKVWIGSVKSNVGHLEAAAGLLGVAKAVLILRGDEIPRVAELTTPDQQIHTDGTAAAIADHNVPWPRAGRTRRIAVNSFGIGGTLGQAIIEDPPFSADSLHSVNGPLPVPVSARTASGLSELARRLQRALDRAKPPLAAVAWTLQTGRAALAERRIILAGDMDQLCAAVTALANGVDHPTVASQRDPAPLHAMDTDLAGGLTRWLGGDSLDWPKLWPAACPPRRVELPGYPFERISHWFDGDIGFPLMRTQGGPHDHV
jgi:3-oxoacyl-[acyl-carrier-protein] synthase II